MSTVRSSAAIPIEVLLEAYAQGIFPMAHEDGELYWHQPDPRAIFDLDTLEPDATTARILRSGRYAFTIDRAFEQVMRACADREETWIDERIIDSFTDLHSAGHAHSLEAWAGEELVGGIYGVTLGGAFFGESMFGTSNAGKAAFHQLVAHLRKQRFLLFDSQYINPFTERLGAYEVSKADFDSRLAHALQHNVRFQ